MTTEQKEAVEKLQQKLNPKEFGGYCVLGYNRKYCFGKSEVEAIETVLNLIKEQQEKLEKKDKIIDLMAELVYKRFKAELLLEYGFENEEQLKQYFAGLAEKE